MHLSLKTGLVLAAFALAAVPASAQTQLTDRSQVPGSDVIDWGQLGPAFTTVPSPAAVTSTSGVIAAVSDNGTLERRDEGNGWFGVFTVGDHLLWNQDNGNPITLSFTTPLSAIGAQLQCDSFTTFTGELDVYGLTNNLLGSYFVNGDNTGAEDGSAPFLGVQDATADIYSAVFSTNVGDEVALNNVSIAAGPAAVPEASTTVSLGLLLALGLGGLIVAAKRKKTAA